MKFAAAPLVLTPFVPFRAAEGEGAAAARREQPREDARLAHGEQDSRLASALLGWQYIYK